MPTLERMISKPSAAKKIILLYLALKELKENYTHNTVDLIIHTILHSV